MAQQTTEKVKALVISVSTTIRRSILSNKIDIFLSVKHKTMQTSSPKYLYNNEVTFHNRTKTLTYC